MNKEKLLIKRYKAEKRFQFYGKAAITVSLMFLFVFIFQIFSKGYTAFQKTWLYVEVTYDQEMLGVKGKIASVEEIEALDFYELATSSLLKLDANVSRGNKRDIIKMFAYTFEEEIKDYLLRNPQYLGKNVTVPLTASDDLDQVYKGNYPRDIPEERRRVNNYQLKLFDEMTSRGHVSSSFNLSFFTNADSREAELAGIASSLVGSIYSILVCLLFSFPIAVAAGIYLVEFAPHNWFTDFLEVNINNLAAVPSIVFGLLGLGVLLAIFDLPRSTPLVGGITLSLMTLPTIIIACRASLKAVPPSIKEAALAMGASKMQTTFHHTVPLSMPGTLSGMLSGTVW